MHRESSSASRRAAAPDDASRPTTAPGDASSVDRHATACAWCREGIPTTARRDSIYCSKRCRQASWRFGVRRVHQVTTDRAMRFAYADPPYPGKADYYDERQEVDHASLLQRLTDGYPDGWALSTSAAALRDVLPLCPPDVRVCAWVRSVRSTASYKALSSWEPLLVAGGRPRPVVDDVGRRVIQTLQDSLVYRGRYRAFPGALTGMKPPQFAVWLFELLGAQPGDELADLFPGSGAVSEAWLRHVGNEASLLETRPVRSSAGRRVA